MTGFDAFMRLNYDLTAYYIKIKMEKMSSLTGNLPIRKPEYKMHSGFLKCIYFSVPPAQTQLAPVPSGFDIRFPAQCGQPPWFRQVGSMDFAP